MEKNAAQQHTAKQEANKPYQFVPFKDRESQKPKYKQYIFEWAKFFIISKLSALVGVAVGAWAEKNKVGNPLWMNKANMGTLFGSVAAIYEAYTMWGRTEKKRFEVEEIATKAKAAIDPEPLLKEIESQEKLEQKLDHLQKHLSRRGPQGESFVDRLQTPPIPGGMTPV